MNTAVVALYIIITVLFSLNLKQLYQKYKEGNKKISKASLMATLSLILTFLSLSIYFIFSNLWIVIFSQIYLLSTMLVIKITTKQEKK